jgi:juvenile hormone acid methyltransferase
LIRRKALENIYGLLKPDGVCLLVFLASCPIYDVYLRVSRIEKYAKYYHDVKKYISPLHFDANPDETFGKILADVGFQNFQVEVRDKIYEFKDENLLKGEFFGFSEYFC